MSAILADGSQKRILLANPFCEHLIVMDRTDDEGPYSDEQISTISLINLEDVKDFSGEDGFFARYTSIINIHTCILFFRPASVGRELDEAYQELVSVRAYVR